MHPMAGPWLSPKVVTVNSLPMVLPDIVYWLKVACGPFSGQPSSCFDLRAKGVAFAASMPVLPGTGSGLRPLQLLARQQEHPAAAALELQPHAGQAREGPSHRALGVAHLDDQHAARTQMPARLLEDDAHRVQARLAGRERHARLVPVFRRQSLELTRPHVRRIRHDDIVGGAPERAEVIGLLEQYTAPETVGAAVGARHLERRLRDGDRSDPGARQPPR